jgi:predicted lipid-binding transport protein (Tim44 family)
MWVNDRAGLGASSDSLSGMLGGMFAGMTWGMVISVALYRVFLVWRTQPDRRLKIAANQV